MVVWIYGNSCLNANKYIYNLMTRRLVSKATMVLRRWGVKKNVWLSIELINVHTDVSSVSPSSKRIEMGLDWIRTDEGLTFEKSALESLHGGQFTFSYPLC